MPPRECGAAVAPASSARQLAAARAGQVRQRCRACENLRGRGPRRRARRTAVVPGRRSWAGTRDAVTEWQVRRMAPTAAVARTSERS